MRAPAGGAAPSSARGGAAGRRRGGRAPWRSGARRASGTRSAAARVARTRSTAAGPCRPPRGSACRRRRRRSSGTWARATRVDAKGRRRAAGRREKGRSGGLSERRVAWTRRRGALLVEDLVAPSAEEHRGVVDGVRRARPRRKCVIWTSRRVRADESTTFRRSCPHRAPNGAARLASGSGPTRRTAPRRCPLPAAASTWHRSAAAVCSSAASWRASRRRRARSAARSSRGSPASASLRAGRRNRGLSIDSTEL